MYCTYYFVCDLLFLLFHSDFRMRSTLTELIFLLRVYIIKTIRIRDEESTVAFLLIFFIIFIIISIRT